MCIRDRNDIVTFKPDPWILKDKFETDRMLDWGLLSRDGYLYGKIISDASYKDKFNPFNYQMELLVFICNEDEEMIGIKENINTLHLTKTEGPKQWREKMKNLE